MRKTKRRKSRRTCKAYKARKGGMVRKTLQMIGSNAFDLGSQLTKDAVKNEVFGNKYSKQYKNLHRNENVNPNITRKNLSSYSFPKSDFEIQI